MGRTGVAGQRASAHFGTLVGREDGSGVREGKGKRGLSGRGRRGGWRLIFCADLFAHNLGVVFSRSFLSLCPESLRVKARLPHKGRQGGGLCLCMVRVHLIQLRRPAKVACHRGGSVHVAGSWGGGGRPGGGAGSGEDQSCHVHVGGCLSLCLSLCSLSWKLQEVRRPCFDGKIWLAP